MLKALSAHSAAKGIGAVSSLIKVRRSEVQQMISELGVIAGGYYSGTIQFGGAETGLERRPRWGGLFQRPDAKLSIPASRIDLFRIKRNSAEHHR